MVGIKQKAIGMKQEVNKNLLNYKLKGIKRSNDMFGYKLNDISRRDIFMIELGRIQVLNSILNITDGIKNKEWKNKIKLIKLKGGFKRC